MKRAGVLGIGIAAALPFAVVLGAVSIYSGRDGAAAGGPAQPVGVSLQDSPVFSVAASPDSVTEGGVKFEISNDGGLPHNLRVIRTDLPVDALPLDESMVDISIVDESLVDVVAESSDLFGAETQSLAADLTPGNYALICNIPGHYVAGMVVGLTVSSNGLPTPTPGPVPWDVNGDGTVSAVDIALVVLHFGETNEGPPEPWDVNGDGTVSAVDIALVVLHFGETNP